MLAGRKILVADDSITIQKVVELSFVDEGAEVVCVNNGREAMDRLHEIRPDIVLADVFMPQVNGYELCEYIKQNEELKHIPVMLLIGSFEPFNESEARRVGADDTLTKPFQSIRRLLEKVGLLAEGPSSEETIRTAEYPKVEQHEPPKLSDSEIELTTADTRPLAPDVAHAAPQMSVPESKPDLGSTTDDANMEFRITEVTSQTRTPGKGELLDLGEVPRHASAPSEEFVLDIDLDAEPEAAPVDRYPAYVGRADLRTTVRDLRMASFPTLESTATVAPREESTSYEQPDWSTDQFAKTQEVQREWAKPEPEPSSLPSVASAEPASLAPSGMITLEQLSPEVIDAIARRAVEQLSEKVVQEIAWEVVPQLAELIIKRQLEEKGS